MQLYWWCLPATAKNNPLWHLTVFPLHPLTTELAVARQRLKIGSKEGMVNRLGPEPKLFLLRFLLIHLDTSHFSKDASWMVPVSPPILRVWNIQTASECLIGNNGGAGRHPAEWVTAMFAFQQTGSICSGVTTYLLLLFIGFSCCHFHLHLFSERQFQLSPI